MTGPAAPATEQHPEPSRPQQVTRSIGRAAVLIGALTAAARVIGFGRQLAFAHTVGNSCLGSAYMTANQVPNIIYDWRAPRTGPARTRRPRAPPARSPPRC